MFRLRLTLTVCLCAAWSTDRAQSRTQHTKINISTVYIPQFRIQEASQNNVQAIGIRWLFSDYDRFPLEFGLHAYTGYGHVARISFGITLAYLLAKLKSLDLKIGLSLSKITLKDIDVDKSNFGPDVGDVDFSDIGNDFKPYLELEWVFTKFSSLLAHVGYQIINGRKSVVTAVKGTGLDRHVTGRHETFFYSAAEFEMGVGLSINF